MKIVNSTIGVLITLILLVGCTISQQASGTIIQVDRLAPPNTEAQAPVAQGEPTVKIEPASATINAGETVRVEIQIENMTGLAGAEIEIQFNAAVLQAQDADPGKDGIQMEPGTFPSPDFVAQNEVDNSVGLGTYAAVQLGSAADGSGVLAALTFEAIADGVSDISLNKILLSNGDGQSINATAINGQITVGEGGGPNPTDTPVPVDPTDTPVPVDPTDTPAPVDPTPTDTPSAGNPTPTNTPVVQPPTNTPVPPPAITSTPVPPPIEPPPPNANIPPGATTGFCYRVQPGENLFRIGLKFNIHYNEIALANALWSSDHIIAHQALFIPEMMGNGPNFYISRGGDTLGVIAEQCRLPVDFLAKMNGLTAQDNLPLMAGHVLRIPIPPFPLPSHQPGPPGMYRPAVQPCQVNPCNSTY
ncbi:cohesin domain-containing protein [Anaerolineales bacterium HSG6]|nr:cohesin domain-containing protein [Anaerolineales bacterium HSG6]MDM8529813.1 cohesin domain-containing protein [Anaerolineales bacterium HSG25]